MKNFSAPFTIKSKPTANAILKQAGLNENLVSILAFPRAASRMRKTLVVARGAARRYCIPTQRVGTRKEILP